MEKTLPGFTPLPSGNRHRSAVDLSPQDAEQVVALAKEEAERSGGPVNVAGTLRALVHGALRECRERAA